MSAPKQLHADLGFIHRFIPGKSAEAPTLLVLHGTGGDETDLLSLAKMIDRNAAILSPRGKVLENGMPRFFRRLAEGVFDIADLKFRTAELAEFVSTASKVYGFDPSSVIALGYSNGANIGASLLLLKPDTISRALLFRAMLPLKPDHTPRLTGKKVFISAGRMDAMIPREGTVALQELLEKAGAQVTLNWVESTHSLIRPEIEQAKVWLHE
ncbi:MAG TPA: alpha/beta hydrolase [Nitrososphaerales archaeon]|nr:alpha/beta hydrolase [Nitrososphaerales archaeon]